MRKNFRNVGFYPQPVLVVGTYDQDGIPDAMNVGWGGLVGGTYVELNISRGHKTTENIRQKRAFTLSFADQANLVAADYVGLVSGYDVPDKIARAGLHPIRSDFVDAPLFEELPLTLECQVVELTEEGPGGVRIVGRKDYLYTNGSRFTAAQLMPTGPDDRYTVWLDHEPRDFKNAAAAGADLILSGHTHGGQMILGKHSMLTLSPQETRYPAGWSKESGVFILVSQGVGCEIVDLRLGTEAQVHLITLRRGLAL